MAAVTGQVQTYYLLQLIEFTEMMALSQSTSECTFFLGSGRTNEFAVGFGDRETSDQRVCGLWSNVSKNHNNCRGALPARTYSSSLHHQKV